MTSLALQWDYPDNDAMNTFWSTASAYGSLIDEWMCASKNEDGSSMTHKLS